MKKLLGLMLATATLPFYPLIADFNESLSDTDAKIESAQDRGPFTLSVEGDYYGKADFSRHPLRHQKIQYYIVDAEASMVVYYDAPHKEGLAVAFGYIHDRIDWKQNPFFSEKDFNTVALSLSGFSNRTEDWLWESPSPLFARDGPF